MEKKKKRKKKRHGRRRITPMQSLLQGLFLGFCICLLVFSLWKLASIFMGYHSGEKEYDDLRQYVLSEPADAENTTAANHTEEDSENEGDATASTSQRMEHTSLKTKERNSWGVSVLKRSHRAAK